MKFNLDCHLFCFGTFSERYVPDGYYDDVDVKKAFETIASTPVKGFMNTWKPALLPEDPEKNKKFLAEYGLVPSLVLIDNFGDRMFRHGAYSTSQKDIQKENMKLCKDGIDFAKALGVHSVLLWPAHDGMDYPFSVDYRATWDRMVDNFIEIAEYAGDMKLAIEPKPQDPRQKMLVNSTGKAMMLVNDIGRDNVGLALDVGHSFAAAENPAEACVVMDRHNKLFQVHLNDNYKNADPDMIFGTVNFWENLEFMYYLLQTDFDGWCSVDIIANRENREDSFKACVGLIEKYYELASRLAEKKDVLQANMEVYRFSKNIELISSIIFK